MLAERIEIDNVCAQSNSDPTTTSSPAKDPIREVLDREVTVRTHVQERHQGHKVECQLKLACMREQTSEPCRVAANCVKSSRRCDVWTTSIPAIAQMPGMCTCACVCWLGSRLFWIGIWSFEQVT